MPTNIGSAREGSAASANPLAKRYIIAWALALVFYFLEYAARSSPAVMIPQLSAAFGATAVGVSAIIGTYYYTYSVTNLVAGVALDRAGGKWVIAIGAFVLAAGCFGFAVPSSVGPVFARFVGKGFETGDHIAHFRSGASFWIVCILVAIGLSALLRETGHARRPT